MNVGPVALGPAGPGAGARQVAPFNEEGGENGANLALRTMFLNPKRFL